MSNNAVQLFNGMGMDQAFAGLDPNEESLADGIGGSYGVIGYKGKVWSLRLRGENHLFLRQDDGSPMAYIDAVILRQARVKAKSFYPGGFEENSSTGKRPDCASIDGITPDSDALKKQADHCAICPRNEWKNDPKTGKKTRECADYKRLSVLVLPTLTKPILGEALIEPVFLRIPPASLNDLAIFGDMMQKQGFHYSSFVTRISFDPAMSHPKFVFKAIQRLTKTEAPVILALREDQQARRITGEDQIEMQAKLTQQGQALRIAPEQSIGLVSTQVSTQGQAGQAQGNVVTIQPRTQQATAQQVAPQRQQQATQQRAQHVPQDTGLGDMGFGGLDDGGAPSNHATAFITRDDDPEPYTPQPGAAVGQTDDDTGGFSSIDDPSMDEKIKNLLG